MVDGRNRRTGEAAHDHHRQDHDRDPAGAPARHGFFDDRRNGVHELKHEHARQQRAEQLQMQNGEHAGECGDITADLNRRQLGHAHIARQPHGPDCGPVLGRFVALSHESFGLLPRTGYRVLRPEGGPARAWHLCVYVMPPISAAAATAQDIGR